MVDLLWVARGQIRRFTIVEQSISTVAIGLRVANAKVELEARVNADRPQALLLRPREARCDELASSPIVGF